MGCIFLHERQVFNHCGKPECYKGCICRQGCLKEFLEEGAAW